jgi:DNA-binding LacI/PurR family transcriptional regulator
VLEAAEELGYRPDQRARLLGRNRSRTIGVVFGLHHEFNAEMVEHLYQAMYDTGFELALGAVVPTRGERAAIQSLIDYRCEALILVGPFLPGRAIEELTDLLPVVVVARAMRSRLVDVVRTDDVDGARLAVEHLVGADPTWATLQAGHLTDRLTLWYIAPGSRLTGRPVRRLPRHRP